MYIASSPQRNVWVIDIKKKTHFPALDKCLKKKKSVLV